MINTNIDKPTQKSTATISESNIYLKKSELPQNVSSFKNDAGYISSSALSTWLKEHAYISKTEITSLINKANLVVVDTVNKSADSDAINRLNLIEKEIVEIKEHPWFVGVQFHHEFKSRPNRAHPLFKAFIAAALKFRASEQRSLLHM